MNELGVQQASRIEELTSNPLQRRILHEAVEMYDIDPHTVRFGDLMNIRRDDSGEIFIEDLNGVVRYYPEEKLTIPTDEYEELVEVSTHNSYAGISPTSILQRRGQYQSS